MARVDDRSLLTSPGDAPRKRGDRFDAEPDPVWGGRRCSSSPKDEQEDGDTELHTGDHHAFPTSQQYAYVTDGDRRARFVRVVVA